MRLRTHHIGIVVRDIPTIAAYYADHLGYEVATGVIHDPTQTAHVQFLRLPGEAVYLELVAPDGPGSRLANALAKGGGPNHVCYATDDMEAACRQLHGRGMRLVHRPVAAVAFPGRRIAWLIGPDRTLVELVDEGPAGEP